jgi:putative hemolysin
MNVALEISIILLLLVANGILAGSEIAVVTSRKSRLRRRAEGGEVRAAHALELANSPNRFLSTVQIGITAVAVIAGAFGGARIARSIAPALASAGVPVRFVDQAAIVLVVLLITYTTLVIGELVPKRIALNDPERVALRVAGAMRRLSILATPLVRLLGASTDLVLRLFRLRDRPEAEVTEDEIRGMIAHATETGVLEATEQQIVERLFRLSDATAATVMTPREDIIWLDRRGTVAEWRERLGDVRHTRYIVADGDLDRHLGYVNVQELLRGKLGGRELDIGAALRKPHIVPWWTPAFRLLELFQWSGDHIALITGDRGEVAGVVTLNDLLEGIVGDIPDLHEVVAPGVLQREDGSWLVDGLLDFGEFVRIFRRADAGLPHFTTVHAFVSERLGRKPVAAAAFNWRGLRIEIVDMDGSRVDKVLVTELP